MSSARAVAVSLMCAALLLSVETNSRAQQHRVYRVETRTSRQTPLRQRFSSDQLALLEQLNRADLIGLERLSVLVVPESWDDDLAYSPLPVSYPYEDRRSKLLIVHLPGQLFGAYENGRLIRWGPISSGGHGSSTPAGLFHLNWKSTGRASTVNPKWFMRWYFNFGSREGLAFHEYSLPGVPASHGCIRLLARDAQWLFGWGEGWTLSGDGRIVNRGTPVLVLGEYNFAAFPPWRSLTWLERTIALPKWDQEKSP
jgi:hypothetical protein